MYNIAKRLSIYKSMQKMYFFILMSSLTLTGCLFPKEDECVSYYPSNIRSADVPTQLPPQQTANISIVCETLNGCGRAYAIETTSIGDTLAIKAVSKYSGCACTQAIGEYTTNFSFNPPGPGIYYFKFLNNDGSFFTRSMVAN